MNFQNYNKIFDRSNYPKFDSKTFVPRDGDPCICLSGNRFDQCCKKEIEDAENNRQENPKLSEEKLKKQYHSKKVLSEVVQEKSVRKKNIAYCAASMVFSDCDDSVIRHSHTMAQGNVLKKLSAGEKIICFNDHIIYEENEFEKNINSYYSEVNTKQASVTVSFCKKHDEELFSEIEKDGKSEYTGLYIQNLEYALKAISFDIYYKIMNIKYLAQLVLGNKFVTKNPDGSNSEYFKNYYYTLQGLFELVPYLKKILEEHKENNDKEKLKTIAIKLPVERVNFSLSEAFEFEGQIYFVNVLNDKNPLLLFSYYPDHASDSSKKINEIKNKVESENELFDYAIAGVTYALLINAQNIYFNKKAFYALPDEFKKFLYIVHREGTKNIPQKILSLFTPILIDFLYDLSGKSEIS